MCSHYNFVLLVDFALSAFKNRLFINCFDRHYLMLKIYLG